MIDSGAVIDPVVPAVWVAEVGDCREPKCETRIGSIGRSCFKTTKCETCIGSIDRSCFKTSTPESTECSITVVSVLLLIVDKMTSGH